MSVRATDTERIRRGYHIPGYRYLVCDRCGCEWNVSRLRWDGPYICPACVHKDKIERGEAK